MILSLTSSILLWYSEKLDFWISRSETADSSLSVIWVILAKNLIPRHALGELFGPSTRSDIVLYKIKLGWNYWIGTFYHLKSQNKILLPCPITRIFSYRDGHPNSELGFGFYGVLVRNSIGINMELYSLLSSTYVSAESSSRLLQLEDLNFEWYGNHSSTQILIIIDLPFLHTGKHTVASVA